MNHNIEVGDVYRFISDINFRFIVVVAGIGGRFDVMSVTKFGVEYYSGVGLPKDQWKKL